MSKDLWASTASNLAKPHREINISIRRPMQLAIASLHHFKSNPNGAIIVSFSNVLDCIQASVINTDYNDTNAWMHFWRMTLRTQLKDT